MDRQELLAVLRRDGIRDDHVLDALAAVPRDEFVGPEHRAAAWENHPLPIGWGQTISQPLIVAYMTELMDVRPGDKILDVGTGCGYQAAVLAQLGGDVTGIELLPELATRAQATLDRLGYDVTVAVGDGWAGLPEVAPFDAIAVAAAAESVPVPLMEQLRPPDSEHRGGRLVVPVSGPDGGQRLVLVERTAGGWRQSELDRVRFVPLIHD